MDFGFYYNSADENPNVSESDVATSYSTLRALDVAGTKVYFKLIYPDGTGYSWNGTVSVKRSAAEVNQAISFTLRIMCESDLTDITESA